MRRGGEPKPMGELMDSLIRRRSWGGRLAIGTLRSGWAAAVGDLVASHSEPIRLGGGVLTIRAESGAWSTELVLLGPEIARKADEYLGGDLVREVRVVAGTVGRAAERPDPSR